MNPNTTTQLNNLPVIIVDTNIFGNLFDKNTNTETFKIIDELSNKYTLAISKITLMEVAALGTHDVVKIINIFSAFRKFEIEDNILSMAGLIYCTKRVRGQNDSIIASTVFLNNAFLLTSNQQDFPEPLFNEVKCWHINHKDERNRTMTEHIYLLRVNPEKVGKVLQDIDYAKDMAKEFQTKKRAVSTK